MKFKLLLFSVLLAFTVSSVQAQSKKELESSLAKTTASKDSVQKLYDGLSVRFDSVSKACLVYDGMYKTIKEKLVHYNFEPSKVGHIMDSLQVGLDSLFKLSRARYASVRDSVKRLTKISDSLQDEISHLNFMVNKYIGRGTIPNDIKDLVGNWEVNLRWYKIVSDSLQSGIILMPSSPDSNAMAKLVFVDFETVLAIFSKGDTVKCFYTVNGFAKDKPWSMDISRAPKVAIHLDVNPFDGELYVSYRKDRGFYYGFMRKK